ncbi:MAG: DUF1156 domain-containing protein [Candidatus Jordarchaeales archaeon]
MEIGNNNADLEKRFIESVNFPFSVISEASEPEKGPGRPPHWKMVFWWTRKPLISARAIIAGCLLPEKTNPSRFLRSIGITIHKRRADGKPVFEKTPHRINPTLKFKGVKLLDPFAGFGSIPLEGLRLGLDVTAVELLPTAYVFLKAILEYPAKYGKKLVEDVEKWGNWITERLREDPLIKELYDEDVAVYIGSWEVKCPHCERWTPLVGNWWLARVKAGEGYERLAWMEPIIEGDEVKIKVVDLNKVLGDRAVKDARVSGLRILTNGKEFRVPESNIDNQRNRAVCLVCNQTIRFIDLNDGRHKINSKNKKNQQLYFYVKYALSKFNEGDASLARYRLLVKVKIENGHLIFETATKKDDEKLGKASKKLEELLKQGDPDIPYENMQPYGGATLGDIYKIFHKFRNLFNPRQLLTHVKLVKLIREVGKKIEEEKQKEGQTREKAYKYAEAVMTYFVLTLCKGANYNSIATRWDSTWWKIGETLSTRGIAMNWNWCDINPLLNYIGSWAKSLNSSIESLNYLISAISNNVDSIEVWLDDANVLNKIDLNKLYTLIVTDPPYYDDVPYAELSDFYYVWLKRALSDVEESRLVPRFIPEAFFEKAGDDWVEISTQWEKFALSEISVFPLRLGANAKYEEGVRHFQNLLNSSFITMASRLEDNGLLVTYYAHTDPDAWKALLEAGWEAASLRVTNAFPVTTESTQSVVKRGKLSMDTSIVVVWRKGCQGSIEASELYAEMVEEASERARKLLDLGIIGRDLIIGTLAAALAVATRYREIRVMGKIDVSTLVDKYVYPATYLGLAKAFAGKADSRESVKTPDGMFYLIVKSTVAGAKKKILESTDARIFSIGTSLDLNSALKDLKILKAEEREGGAKVAKAKALRLLEPTFKEGSKLAEFLEVRGVGVTEPKIRCSVDALHLLEYWAVRYAREEFKRRLEEVKVKYPVYVEDALNMARIMARVLPSEDVEKELCVRMVEYLEPPAPGLSKFVKQGEE